MNGNRPFQMDHFQINRAWQDLNVVIDNTEISAIYLPSTPETAPPYTSPEELYSELRDQLAPLEMTLALEYLYARFSLVREPNPQWPDMEKHTEFLRHYLLLIAVSEMHHLRWANELLWSLTKAFPGLPRYRPVLTPALNVPLDVNLTRPRALRPLEPEVLADFIAAESRSGTINGSTPRSPRP
jgi:Ferritin-like